MQIKLQIAKKKVHISRIPGRNRVIVVQICKTWGRSFAKQKVEIFKVIWIIGNMKKVKLKTILRSYETLNLHDLWRKLKKVKNSTTSICSRELVLRFTLF
jgi:hypothetical protein